MRRTSALNPRAALVLATAVLGSLLLGVLLWFVQTRRVHRAALDMAQQRIDEGQDDEAIRQLDQLLRASPKDPTALKLMAKVTARRVESVGQLLRATAYNEDWHRQLNADVHADPGEVQEVRKRLINLYVITGEKIRLSRLYKTALEISQDNPYPLAWSLARQVVDQEIEHAVRNKTTIDPTVCRLEAMVREGPLMASAPAEEVEAVVQAYKLALLGGTKTSFALSPPKTAQCVGNPADLDSATRLVNFFLARDRRADAEDILDQIERARPNAAMVHLLGHHLYRALAAKGRATVPPNISQVLQDEQRARDELTAAIKIARDDPDPAITHNVVMIAAEDALRRGNAAEARRYLEQVPADRRGEDLGAAFLEGLIAWAEERPLGTIDVWRRGLVETGGTNVLLTWWLAYIHLQANQVAEAERLIEQYRRLSGDTENSPPYQILKAGLDIRLGCFHAAITTLERVRNTYTTNDDQGYNMLVKVHLLLGQAHEALRNFTDAQAAYDRAVQLDPNGPEPRITRARFFKRRDPQRATLDLEEALAKQPEDFGLITALASATQEQLARLPQEQRDLGKLDALLGRARAINPESPTLVLLQANRHLLAGQAEEAVHLLEKNLQPLLGENQPDDPSRGTLSKDSEGLLTAYVEALVRLGRDDEADRALEMASRPGNFGDRVALRVVRANRLLARGRGRDAQTLLEANWQELTRSDQIQLTEALGQLRLSQGNIRDASDAFATWARLAPQDIRPRLLLVDLALLTGQDQLAQNILNAVKPQDTNDPIGLRKADVAVILAEAALRVRELESPTAPSSPEELKTRLDAVKNLLGEAAKARGDKLPAYTLLQGRLDELQGDVAHAIGAYQAAWNDGQGTPAALPRLIGLLARAPQANKDALAKLRGQLAEGLVDPLAIALVQTAAERASIVQLAGEAARIQGLATARRLEWVNRFLQLGQLDQAEETLRALVKDKPEVPEAWIDLVRLQAMRNQATASTIAQAQEAVKTDHPDLFEARCLWVGRDRLGADRAFRRLLERNPNDLDALGDASLFAREGGELDRAIGYLRHLHQLAPERRRAALDLAMFLSEITDEAHWDEAWTVLGREGAGETLDERLARASVLTRAPDAKRKARAIPILEALLADLPGSDPRMITVRKLLAREYFVARQFDRAHEAIRAVVLTIDDPAALGMACETLIALKRWGEAEDHVQRLERLDAGGELAVSTRLALAKARAGPTQPIETLVAVVESALQQDPSPHAQRVEVMGRSVFQQALAQGPPALDAADKIANALAARSPGLAWMRSAVLARRGQPDQALALCLETARVAQGHNRVDMARVASEVALDPGATADQFAKAEAVLATVKSSGPPHADLLVIEGMLRHHRGQYEEEARLCREALDIDPKNAIAQNNLAWVLSEGLNRPAEGLEHIEALIAQIGRAPGLLDSRGVILLRLNRTDQAIADLQEAARSQPIGPVYFHLARAYLQAGWALEFREARDQAKRTGLLPIDLDLVERDEFDKLMNIP